MNSRGVSLIELMIYIVLTAIIVVTFSAPFKDILKHSAASKKNSQLQSSSRDAISILSREIRNTGIKRYPISPNSNIFDPTIIMNAFLPDSSSFMLKEGNPGDTLTIYKASINDAGQCTGGADSIQFYLSADTLKRKFNGTAMNLTQGVYAMQFKTGLVKKDSLLFKDSTFFTSHWIKGGVCSHIMTSNNHLSIDFSGAGSGSVVSVNTFDIQPAARIKVKFSLTGTTDKIDTLRWSILDNSNSTVGSEIFKPGITDGEYIIPVPAAVTFGKIQFEAVCNGAASVVLNSLEVRTIDRGGIIWSDTVSVNEKKNVKALQICLLLRSSSQTDSPINTAIAVANVVVNRTGHYSWRLLKETVEIPNNGLFN